MYQIKPNEWYSYLTEKRTSTVALLINLIIAITLVGIKRTYIPLYFFLYTYIIFQILGIKFGLFIQYLVELRNRQKKLNLTER